MGLKPPLGLFGGTFDPIHHGHILPALEAAKQTHIERVALMPNYIPGHKQGTHSSSEHRLAMVRLVCQQYPIFYPENWEIQQARVTYSIDTLIAFRQRNPDTPLCFFIGSDSLYTLPSWHRWDELLGLCHFVVCQRDVDLAHYQSSPHYGTLQILLSQHQTFEIKDLHQSLAGHIFLANTSLINVSSTQIRKTLSNLQQVQNLLPSAIYQYIQQYKLYQQSNKL